MGSAESYADSFDISGQPDIAAHWPKYCEYSKFLLVEELALEENFEELHYGSCCVIGVLQVNNTTGDFELANIEVPGLPREYSLPQGTLAIPLLLLQPPGGTNLSAGRMYEVYAEVILVNTKNPAANVNCLTSRGVLEQLATLQSDKEQVEYRQHLQQVYKAALRVNHLQQIDRAGELAMLNLQIRIISQEKQLEK